MAPLSFIVVGSGWRAMFYVRIALRYPQCFALKYLLCRTEEKAKLICREYGIPVTTSVQACEAAHPDLVVVAVGRNDSFPVTAEWLNKGYPVLAETPAAQTEAELEKLWALRQAGARLQIAEQYIRYPLIAAGLRAIDRGLLGEPQAVTLSLAHDYHAVSLIRHMLRPEPGAVRLRGLAYSFPVEETDSRAGPVRDGSVMQRPRSLAAMEFPDGKAAFYDFSGVQYHSFIRARHINVQGPRGEWNDTTLRYVDAGHLPARERLKPYLDPAYAPLHTPELLAISRVWQPEVHMETWQDEYAIASMLLDMGDYIRHGREVYPLAEALEDAYLWLLMDRAIKDPGPVLESQPHAWNE